MSPLANRDLPGPGRHRLHGGNKGFFSAPAPGHGDISKIDMGFYNPEPGTQVKPCSAALDSGCNTCMMCEKALGFDWPHITEFAKVHVTPRTSTGAALESEPADHVGLRRLGDVVPAGHAVPGPGRIL